MSNLLGDAILALPELNDRMLEPLPINGFSIAVSIPPVKAIARSISALVSSSIINHSPYQPTEL
jgi:hypothetical protein